MSGITERRPRPFLLMTSLLGLTALTVTIAAAPAANAANAADAAAAYSPPPEAWAQFQSDLNAAGETVTTDLGSGVLSRLSAAFKAPAKPCADKNVRC